MTPTGDTFDVAVIGAGVVGAAIARELSRYRLRCALVDAAADVGTGTSKANTAILHTGFDAKPGTLEARLVRRGHELLSEYAPRAGIALEHTGALLVAWDDEQLAALPRIAENSRRNGIDAIRELDAAELYRREPALGPGARGALEIADESIICPFTTPLAFATQAVVNGVALFLSHAVESAERVDEELWQLRTSAATLRSRYVVNAAGLHADSIDRLFGHSTFSVTPRRGELIVFDKLARSLVNHIVLQVPTSVSKGVLVSPTVFGNVMLGPTAEDLQDKTATGSTAAGLASLLERGRRIMPRLIDEEVTAVYVGLRAATEHADYQIRFDRERRYVCVGGIRSTGLTASPAIAEYVGEGLADMGLRLDPVDDFREVRMPAIGEAFSRPHRDGERIAANPDYGRIVCHCERVSLGEIVDATRAAIPARSLDGVRRRTRALLGRCQGFFCLAEVASLVAAETRQPVEALLRVPRADGAARAPRS